MFFLSLLISTKRKLVLWKFIDIPPPRGLVCIYEKKKNINIIQKQAFAKYVCTYLLFTVLDH